MGKKNPTSYGWSTDHAVSVAKGEPKEGAHVRIIRFADGTEQIEIDGLGLGHAILDDMKIGFCAGVDDENGPLILPGRVVTINLLAKTVEVVDGSSTGYKKTEAMRRGIRAVEVS